MGRENYGALANLDIDDALAQIAAGASLAEVGKQYGVTAVSLRAAILRGDSERYRAALAAQVASRLVDYAEDADAALPLLDKAQRYVEEGEIAAAQAQTNIARARLDGAESGAKHWRWLGERRLPDVYGQKTQVKQEHSGTVAIEVRPRVSREEWVRAHALRDDSAES